MHGAVSVCSSRELWLCWLDAYRASVIEAAGSPATMKPESALGRDDVHRTTPRLPTMTCSPKM